jgi:hypothetical protein
MINAKRIAAIVLAASCATGAFAQPAGADAAAAASSATIATVAAVTAVVIGVSAIAGGSKTTTGTK